MRYDRGIIEIRFTPRVDYGDVYFAVFVNGLLAQTVYAAANTEQVVFARAESGANHIAIIRLGAVDDVTAVNAARSYDSDAVQYVSIRATWSHEVIGTFDSDGAENVDLTSWTLAGIYPDSVAMQGERTRGKLDCDLTVASGMATVELYRDNTLVASGSGSVGTTVTLAEQNDSGISGTVAVDAAATTSEGAELLLRWQSYAAVLRDSEAVGRIYFDRARSTSWTEPSALAAGTYAYSLRTYSDTGDAGGSTTPENVTVPGPPVAPTSLAYTSGNYTNTVLGFTGSTTAGATYNLYLQQPDDAAMDFGEPAATAAAGATSIALPTITGYPGTAQVWLRAVSGGTEETTGARLSLEYDAAGAYVAPRPNAAYVKSALVTSGTTLTVIGLYDNTNQAGTATELRLFTRTPDGSYNLASAASSGTLSSTDRTYLKQATMSATLANGWHYYTVYAATAAGVLSATGSDEALIYVSDADAAAVSATIQLGRSA